MPDTAETSGFTPESFRSCIKYSEIYNLTLHIEEGFDCNELDMGDAEKSRPFDYAMRTGLKKVAMLLAPHVAHDAFAQALEKHKDLYKDDGQFIAQLTQQRD